MTATTITDMLLDSTTLYTTAMWYAAASTAALVVSHVLCVGIIMYYDLSGQWDDYRLHKSTSSKSSRNVSLNDYTKGMKNFAKDLVLLFFPFMTGCYAMRLPQIQGMLYNDVLLYCTLVRCCIVLAAEEEEEETMAAVCHHEVLTHLDRNVRQDDVWSSVSLLKLTTTYCHFDLFVCRFAALRFTSLLQALPTRWYKPVPN